MKRKKSRIKRFIPGILIGAGILMLLGGIGIIEGLSHTGVDAPSYAYWLCVVGLVMFWIGIELSNMQEYKRMNDRRP